MWQATRSFWLTSPLAKLPNFGNLTEGRVVEQVVGNLSCRKPLGLRLKQVSKADLRKYNVKLSKRVKMLPWGATKRINYYGTIR